MLSQSSADDAGNRANVCARIVAPVLPLVTLEQARLHLRLDAIGSPAAHPDDALIQALVQSATDELDGWNGDLGRALVTQTWEYAAPFFNGPALTLPLPPLQSVTSVRYLDEAGAEQTIDASNYRVRINGDMPGAVILNEGYSWPSHAVAEDAVRVRFVCGFGDDPDDVPQAIRTWIKLRLGQFYENREAVISGTTFSPLPQMDALVDRYRIRRVWQ